jgi:putative component of toxin-antitoxin plasmid stabilization module
MLEVREYLDRSGRSPFAAWSDRLNREAAVKVAAALARIQQGNFSNAKGVGAGLTSNGLILVLATGFTSGKTETGL